MKLLKSIVLFVLTVLSVSAYAAKQPLDVEVSVAESYVEGGNVYATLKITNNGKSTQKLLKWYTELEEQHIFTVTHNGKKVPYQGPYYKRHAPTDKDFIKLKAGQSIEKTFELSGFYDMSQSGSYTVSYDVRSFYLFGNKGQAKKAERKAVKELKSNSVTFWMDGISSKGNDKTHKGKPGSGSSDCVNGICFTGRCDNIQKNEILSALAAADNMANNSVSYLNSHSSSNVSQRYLSWFGSSTNSRYNTASANFDAINDAIDNQSLTFDCKCKQNYFAYVYANDPYKIYLCKAFWAANETGTDSRAGTIIHELSHFNVVAGTDDVVYGQSGARSLADSNPDQALNNADSHEYFAENTPYEN